MARPRAADYDEKRALILRACADLFARQGYERTSISDIAKACHVSKALIYHYYTSKEQLLVDIIGTHLSYLIDMVERALDGASPGEPQLRAIVGALLEAYRDASALHKIQLNELSRLPAPSQVELKAQERQLVALFADVLATCVPPLAGSDRLKPVTMSLFGMLNWHYMWFRPDGRLTRESYADLATTIILTGAREIAGRGRMAAE
ncbi:MAG: TetR/AcrR family transcriptional regulator [Alphaproteobacteria bacterium]